MADLTNAERFILAEALRPSRRLTYAATLRPRWSWTDGYAEWPASEGSLCRSLLWRGLIELVPLAGRIRTARVTDAGLKVLEDDRG